MNTTSNILLYDIETMGERGWYFPPRYDTNILHVDHYEHLLSVSWKWFGDKKVEVVGLDDFPGYARDKHNDLKLTKHIAELFDKADIIIAHNGNNFDQKVVQGRMMTHKLSPPSPYKQIDTKTATKRVARFASNKLDDLGRQLELGQKLSHGNFRELWLACDEGDEKAWRVMKRYNKQDVVLLEQLYTELRPWIQNHPALNLMDGRPEACPKCGKGPLIKHKKRQYSKIGWKQQYQCKNCNGYSLGRQIFNPEAPIQFVN